MYHSKQAILYAFSIGVERASYYGIRSILLLFMLDETLNLTKDKAFLIYGIFTGSIIGSKIIGSLLGDLLIGNKRTLIVGGVLQAMACFIFCYQSLTTFYVGIVVFILGNGLFSSNAIAQFGKEYINTPKLLDAGFTLLYMTINIGSFLGVLILGYIAESNFNYGFIVAGILIIPAMTFILFNNENQGTSLSNYKKINLNKRLLYIVAVIIISGIYLIISESTYLGMYTIQEKVFEGIDIIPDTYLSNGLGPYFEMIIISVLALIWTYIYTNSFFKIFLGLVVSALSFLILLFIPKTPSSLSLMIFIFSTFLFSTGEMLISPILNSLITKFSNPKYLAIVLSLVTIPSMIFNGISGTIAEYSNKIGVNTVFIIGAFILLVFGIIAHVLSLLYKKDNRIYLSKEAEEFLS